MQGDPPQDVFLLRSGLVKLIRTQESGHEVIVGLRSTGWLLGAAAAIDENPQPATASTVTLCHVVRISVCAFRTMLRDDPAFSWGVHRMHTQEVSAQLGQLGDLGALCARDRLVHLFDDLAVSLGTDACVEGLIEVPLRQWEIAQLIAVTPPYLCDLLADLERAGIVCRRQGRIAIVRKSARPGASAGPIRLVQKVKRAASDS